MAFAAARGSTGVGTLVYIGGTGRSGGTILDMMLGAHPKVFSLGPVQLLDFYVEGNHYCTCGAHVVDCPVWGQVVASTSGAADRPAREERPPRSTLRRVIELARRDSERRDRASVVGWPVLDHVAAVTEKSILVDSSRSVLRLLRLNETRAERPIVLFHVVRRPAGYVVSRTRSRPWQVPDGSVTESATTPFPAAVLDWLRQNLLVALVGATRFRDRRLVIVYDDLVVTPTPVLTAAASLAGVAYESSMLPPADARDYHLIGGNSARLHFDELRPASTGAGELSAWRSIVVHLTCDWLFVVLRWQSRRQVARFGDR